MRKLFEDGIKTICSEKGFKLCFGSTGQTSGQAANSYQRPLPLAKLEIRETREYRVVSECRTLETQEVQFLRESAAQTSSISVSRSFDDIDFITVPSLISDQTAVAGQESVCTTMSTSGDVRSVRQADDLRGDIEMK